MILLVFFFFVIASAYYLLALVPIFRIEGVTVTGARLLLPDDIIRIANIEKGKSLLLASFKWPHERISKIPIVKKVSFSRVLPATVLIKIEERREAAVCVLKNKQSFILDSEGVILNPTGSYEASADFSDITSLPVMDGLDDSNIEDGKCVSSDTGKGVLKLLSEFEVFVVPQKLKIDVWDINDVSLLVDDVLKVRIGDVSDLKEKMNIFESIYLKVKDRKDNIEYIDVSSKLFPVVKYKS